MTKRIVCGFLAPMVMFGLMGSYAFGAALPNPVDHPNPPWNWHEDLDSVGEAGAFPAPGEVLPLAPAPGPGNVAGPFGFVDPLVSPGPWHIECEVENMDIVAFPAGTQLIVSVPGAVWAYPIGGLAPGVLFQVVGPGGGGTGDIKWPEGPREAIAWTVTWTNGLALNVGVDSGVAELPEDVEPADPTPVTEPPVTELPEDYILVQFAPVVPAVSHWGMIVMTLLVITAGAVILIRRRVRAAA